jgi:LL-diaminopimelate aminotransferase
MRTIKIYPANRIQEVKEYYFSTKLKEIAEMNKRGEDVINLGIGNPDGMPHPSVIQTLNRSSQETKNHGYQSYIGIPELRQAFADWYTKYYQVNLNPDNQILPLIGSKEGIMHISLAFLNPGDGVLVPNPGYPAYAAVSKLVGAKIHTYDLEEALNWQPDLSQLEKSDLSGVKLMWINYPNMPTGQATDSDFFVRLIDFAQRNNILIVNDNPYSFILNDSPKSILATPGAFDCTLELNSLSKSQNMAGWRMGMLAGKAEFIQYVLRVKSNMDSGQFKPMQEAAVQALSLDQNWYDSINAEYRSRRELIWKLYDFLGCSYSKTQNGMFVWAKIPHDQTSGQIFADNILQKSKVFITPGFIFGSKGDQYIRASLCQPKEIIQRATERIKSHDE